MSCLVVLKVWVYHGSREILKHLGELLHEEEVWPGAQQEGEYQSCLAHEMILLMDEILHHLTTLPRKGRIASFNVGATHIMGILPNGNSCIC